MVYPEALRFYNLILAGFAGVGFSFLLHYIVQFPHLSLLQSQAIERALFATSLFGHIILGMAVGGTARIFFPAPRGPAIGMVVISTLAMYSHYTALSSVHHVPSSDEKSVMVYGILFVLNLLVVLRPSDWRIVSLARVVNVLLGLVFGVLLMFFFKSFALRWGSLSVLSWLNNDSALEWVGLHWKLDGAGLLGIATIFAFQDSFLMYAVVDLLTCYTFWLKYRLLQSLPYHGVESDTWTFVFLVVFSVGAIWNLACIFSSTIGESRFGGLREKPKQKN